LRFDRGTLLLTGGERPTKPPAGGPWRFDSRVGGWRCEAMHLRDVSAALVAQAGAHYEGRVRQPLRVHWPDANLPTLRAEQREALDLWRLSGFRGQVVMPTGTGKTEVALAAMLETGVATLVVCPIRDLMYQWHRRILRGLGYDAGILGDRQNNVRPVTVTTYDSACIHMPEIGDRFGLLIFDEVHHLPGQWRREAAVLSTASMRLGLSATPERADGLHADLDWLIGPVVYDLPMAEVKGRTLADYDVVRVPVHLTDDEQARYNAASHTVRTFMAEKRKENKKYSWPDLCADTGRDADARRAQKAYYLKKAIEDRAEEKLRVLEDLFRLHRERVIIFAGSNAMAMDVSRRFLIPTLLGHSRKKERLAVLEGFAAGRFPAVVANQVLDEGVDVPEAKVAVVIGGQASTRQAKQRLGRILRRSGDMRATLYEVVCADTGENERSRERRRSDAYERTRHRRL
jgi:superfamily II DNA or RNA helicase